MTRQIVLLSLAAVCLILNSPVLATDRLVPIIAADTNDTNLVSWWKFNEGNGATAYDSVGGNHGTIHGATWTTDYTGIALDFDGDDYVEVSDDPSLRFTQYDSFSICSWAKPGGGCIVCKMRASAQFGYFGYYIGAYANKYRFTADQSRYFSVSVYTGEFPVDDWSHVIAVYDNKDMKIYLDGELEGTGTFTHDTGSTAPDKDLAIGARSVDSLIDQHFTGIIDDVRIYDRALSSEEVRQVYESACPNCLPIIWISSTEFNFFANEGGPNPESQVLRIRRMGVGTINWEITADCNWLSVEPNSGKCTKEVDDVNIVVDISGLGIGQYECELSISDSNAINSPQTAAVTLYVLGNDYELHVPSVFEKIQDAIDMARNGSSIIVAPGTYTGDGNRDIDFKGKAITVRSIDPEDPCVVAATIINCNGSKADPHRGFYFHSGEGPKSIVSGLTITNGYVYDANGGGIYCSGSSPTIRNCIITNNIAYGRNGNCCGYGEPGCEFEKNGGDCRGGGIFCTANSNPAIVLCTLTNNVARGGIGSKYPDCSIPFWRGDGGEGYGGGIHCESGSSPSIIECTINNNHAFGGVAGVNTGDAFGGGISCISGSNPSIADCDISSNDAHGGDGISVDGGSATVGGDGYGGGIYCDSSSHPAIRGCKIQLNEALGGPGGSNPTFFWKGANAGHGLGGGIYSNSAVNLIIENCTISGNTASGGDGGFGGKMGHHLISRGGDAYGGGLALADGLFENVSNCIIVGNVVRGGDGGNASFYNPYPPGDGGNAFGGGVYWILSTNSSIGNCSVCDNATWGGNGGYKYTGTEWIKAAPDGDDRGSGVYCDNVFITDSIVWGNNASNANQVDGSGLSVSYSCVEQVMAGPGNISADPCFVSGPDGEYYLSQIAAGQASDSPCVDAGRDLAANLGMDICTTRTDNISDAGIIDMGYHYGSCCLVQVQVNTADIDGDGDVDFFDYAWFAMGWPYGTSKQIPRGDVVVDGDLGDWTEGVEWRELDKVYYGNPNDVSEARFALQWDDATNKIYAAVIVHDSDHVFLDEYVRWDASDRLEIYSQGDAAGGSDWLGTYDVAQQYYVAPNSTGDGWATWAYGQTITEDAGLEYAVTVNGDLITYELGVRMFDNYGGFTGGETVITNLSHGQVVGFDLVNCTRWASDGFGMLSENMMTGKSINADQFARYVLVEETQGPTCDLDANGLINYDDLRILVENWLWGK